MNKTIQRVLLEMALVDNDLAAAAVEQLDLFISNGESYPDGLTNHQLLHDLMEHAIIVLLFGEDIGQLRFELGDHEFNHMVEHMVLSVPDLLFNREIFSSWFTEREYTLFILAKRHCKDKLSIWRDLYIKLYKLLDI